MDDKERTARNFNFFSTLPPALQNQLEVDVPQQQVQRRLTAENKAPAPPPINELFR